MIQVSGCGSVKQCCVSVLSNLWSPKSECFIRRIQVQVKYLRGDLIKYLEDAGNNKKRVNSVS